MSNDNASVMVVKVGLGDLACRVFSYPDVHIGLRATTIRGRQRCIFSHKHCLPTSLLCCTMNNVGPEIPNSTLCLTYSFVAAARTVGSECGCVSAAWRQRLIATPGRAAMLLLILPVSLRLTP